MDGPFLGVSAISFCLPGFWLCLGALCSAVAHLHFVYLQSLWVAEYAFVTGLVLCLTGIVGAYGSTHRCLWPISVFVGAAFAVLSLETATGVIFFCQWNLVEETAKEHDQTGTLLLLLRCIEAHPVIISWLLGSFFILQVSTLFLAAHHAFDISMDAEEPEEETSVEEGERQDEKAPLLLAYEQVYLPKLSKKQASEEEGGRHCQLASHRTRASRRCKVPEWRDVLLTAALLWLAATGLILIIAMVKVGMYQGPGLGHHAMHQDGDLKRALTTPHATSQSFISPALDTFSTQPDLKEDRRHGKEGHADIAGKHQEESNPNDDEGDDDGSDDEDNDHHHHKAAEEHRLENERHDQLRKQKEEVERAHRKKSDSDDDNHEDEDSHFKGSKAKGSSEEHSDKDGDDEDDDEQEDSEQAADELGKKPWKKHHHHKKHRKHHRHCEDEEPSCQQGAPRWFAGVLGVVGVPMLVLSSVAAAGVWTGIGAVLHMFAGASAVFLASEALLMHIVVNHGSILLTAADFDYSNGLQHTLDYASEHTVATPLLIIALLACQAGAMVAAANFGMPIPVKERVISASAQLREKVEELKLPEKAAVLYNQGREKSAAAAVSLRAAASRAAERAGFPAAAARIAAGGSAGDATAAGDHAYTLVAAPVEEGTVADVASQDGSSAGSESKDPWASLRRALHPEGVQHAVRWSDGD
ncbi:g3856 [Coccomyxa elongata]